MVHWPYYEYVGEDLKLEGTRSFTELVDLKDDEVIVFGWILFPSKETRELANKEVPNVPRMAELVTPLTDPERSILDTERMMYGGLRSFVQLSNHPI